MQLYIVLVLSVLQGMNLVRVKPIDEISLKVPESFFSVPEEEMRYRNINFRRPIALYTDANGDFDLTINQNPSRWRETDIEILKDFYKSNILSLYDDVVFTKEEVAEIRGRKYAVFEFISTTAGDESSFRNKGSVRKYTYIQYTVYNGTTLIFNFTSSARAKNQWSSVVPEIMESVALK
ncbi:MAG: hypothetical protein RJQ09_03405 [Cyclobacteriaceae bacterium]